jgi:GNAT superfamily N-acetyltransferase
MSEWTQLSEQVERASMESIYGAAPESLKRQLGLELEEIGTVLVSISTADPSTLLNRAVGLGVDAPATPETIEAIAARFRELNVRRYYLHLHPDARPDELEGWIVAAGLEQGRGWMKFERDLEPPPEARSELAALRVDGDHAAEFGAIVAEGFGMLPESGGLLAAIVDQPDWFCYLAFSGIMPVAAAAMFVNDDAAYFSWAATHADFRGRGAQSVLLERRIVDALELECQVMFTETGEAVAGEEQHSYRNIQRAGFEPIYLRKNFVPGSRNDHA